MLIRISLIVAIVAGLAAGIVGFVQVRERLITTMDDRDEFERQSIYERGEKVKAQTALARTEEELEITQRDLTRTQTELQTMTARAQTQEQLATQLGQELASAKTTINTLDQELERWRATSLTPDQIKVVLAERDDLQEQREVLTEELQAATRANDRLMARLAYYEGDDLPPIMPEGLRGRVVAVDPKYDFVVLDIGGNHGVVPRGELLVNRDGRLITKLRVSSVEPTMSIANVIPAWRDGDVMEGDQVLY